MAYSKHQSLRSVTSNKILHNLSNCNSPLSRSRMTIHTDFQISVSFQSEQSLELGPSNKVRKVPWHSVLILIIADVMKVVINIFLDATVAKYLSLPLSSNEYRVMGWLQERFAEISPEPVHKSQPLEIGELKDAMTKNKKKIKSMMTLLEAQNRLLRALVATIDPKFEFQDGGVATEGSENANGSSREVLHAEKEARKPNQSIKVLIIKMLSNKTE